MYPLYRLFTLMRRSQRAAPAALSDVVETPFYCRPWDIDLFLEMNNGRVLTLYDLGRTDFGIRIGLMETLKKNSWGLVVAGSTVRYRKRIHAFQKVVMRTRLVGVDHRWFYLEQMMCVNGVPCNSAFLRTGVTASGRSLPVSDVAKAMGLDLSAYQLDGWYKDWAVLDTNRPWPPF